MSMPLAPLSTSPATAIPATTVPAPTAPATAIPTTTIPSGAAGHPAASFWGDAHVQVEVAQRFAEHDVSVETLLSRLTATGHELPQIAESWLAAHPAVAADIALHTAGHEHAPTHLDVSADDLSHLMHTITSVL